ncbi:hypothetical protein CEPID_04600 [Corynebacterium epidermidicanis]|uniref:Uncharacterized protein n=1 Tax=Corynebacterium epidermidicanis TaxID=1050174 RepID=A0A0G3GQF4_9CORY|nr:hypothetical protein CEPID_04600 [Corynebacterium epidermidicanis]
MPGAVDYLVPGAVDYLVPGAVDYLVPADYEFVPDAESFDMTANHVLKTFEIFRGGPQIHH